MACANVNSSLTGLTHRMMTLTPGQTLVISASRTLFASPRVHSHQVRRGSMNSIIKSRTLQELARYARIAGVLVAVIVAGLFMAACGDSSGPRTVQSVVIAPTTATVAVGA